MERQIRSPTSPLSVPGGILRALCNTTWRNSKSNQRRRCNMVCVTLCVMIDSKVEWETYLMRWVFQHAKACSPSHQNTHAHTYCSYSWQSCVCVYVRTSLCRLSATDRFIVAEQQRLVFLSLKESVFSPAEFNQFRGVGGGAQGWG